LLESHSWPNLENAFVMPPKTAPRVQLSLMSGGLATLHISLRKTCDDRSRNIDGKWRQVDDPEHGRNISFAKSVDRLPRDPFSKRLFNFWRQPSAGATAVRIASILDSRKIANALIEKTGNDKSASVQEF
jgi:hypothetical protein